MKEFDCDLHLHGLYSGGVSNQMLLPVLAEQSRLKGINVLVSGDILHAKWLEHVKENLIELENGVFCDKKETAFFLIGLEVETNDRVHHLVYLPDISAAESLREKMQSHAILDCAMCGRPKLRMNAEQMALKVEEVGGIAGPSHAFTPYTGIYAYNDSIRKAYGSMGEKISFIELGLSADTYFADLIKENHDFAFFSFSDAHSPWPNRIGREFTRIKMKKPCFSELVKAVSIEKERISLNVGLDPREGKYHCTACNSCFQQFSLNDAIALKWVCPSCKGQIKRGVKDRILMLKNLEENIHPKFRPPYQHLVPLAEIIQLALNLKNPNAPQIQSVWKNFIEAFGFENNALLGASIDELNEVNPEIAQKISAFRNGWVFYIPGGGGNYGKPVICNSAEEFEKEKGKTEKELTEKSKFRGQKTLSDF